LQDGEKKLIGAKFHVVAHHHQVHSNQFDGEGINKKIYLDFTSLLTISTICDSRSQFISFEFRRHVKPQCNPSSPLISSLLKHRPGIRHAFWARRWDRRNLRIWLLPQRMRSCVGKASDGGVTPSQSTLHF
jgi:hypothetical protein